MRLQKSTPTRSGDPLVKDRLTLVGQTLGNMPDTGPNYGSVQAILLDSEQRGIHSEDLMVRWEKAIGTLPGIKSLTFSGMESGPPGDPIEVWLQGHDMKRLLVAADELMARLRKFDGVYQIRSDFSPGKNEMRLALKPEARALGLTVEDLARQVYAATTVMKPCGCSGAGMMYASRFATRRMSAADFPTWNRCASVPPAVSRSRSCPSPMSPSRRATRPSPAPTECAGSR